MSDSEDSGTPKVTAQVAARHAEIKALNQDFSAFTHDANFCLFFKLIKNRKEVDDGIKRDTFFPDYVHQFFVDQERIFGYKKPILKLFYTASRLIRYIHFEYEDKLTRERDMIDPDNIMDLINPVLEDIEYTSDLDSFTKEVESDEEKNFKPPGSLLHSFEVNFKKCHLLSRAQLEQQEVLKTHASIKETKNGLHNGSSSDHLNYNLSPTDASDEVASHKRIFEIYLADRENPNFLSFQARMQSFVMWFIDAANMIDIEDIHWDIFMMFEKTEERYLFVGYSSVYRYYAFPEHNRPRISQVLLLPPFRRNGLGTILLDTMYKHYRNLDSTADITVEDPSDEFIVIRDFLDCRQCAELESFQPEKLKQGWSDEMRREAQTKLKLCRRQVRKVYEILRLKYLNWDDIDEYKGYRLEIKSRLNSHHQKLKIACQRILDKGLELPDDMKLKTDSFRFAALEENYQELERQYKNVIAKLDRGIEGK